MTFALTDRVAEYLTEEARYEKLAKKTKKEIMEEYLHDLSMFRQKLDQKRDRLLALGVKIGP